MTKKYYLYCDSTQEYEDIINSLINEKINYTEEYNINDELVLILTIPKYNLTFEVRWFYSQSDCPKSVIGLLTKGCKPDLFICNEDKEIVLIVESTKTAPVGNAQKQRLADRVVLPIIENIPFLYISPSTGIDQSQKTERKETGIFKIIKDLYPDNFLPLEDKSILSMLESLSEGDTTKYIPKSDLLSSILDRTYRSQISVMKKDLGKLWTSSPIKNKFEILKQSSLGVIESKNILLCPHDRFIEIFPDLTFQTPNNVIIFINRGLKGKDGGPSDPFQGTVGLINLLGKEYNKVFISTHDTNLNSTNKLLWTSKRTGKTSTKLNEFNYIIDLTGSVYKPNVVDIKVKEFKCVPKLGESDVLWLWKRQLPKHEILFEQFPGGSWGGEDNLVRRDNKREDMKYRLVDGKIKSVEGKEKLSDIKAHIKKHGDTDDIYICINNNTNFNGIKIKGKVLCYDTYNREFYSVI
jgi:hypothetical protein